MIATMMHLDPDRFLSADPSRLLCAVLSSVLIGVPSLALAQGAPAPALPTLVLPPVTVVAEKEPAPIERVPSSITAISGARLDAAGITVVSDAAWLAPNTFYSDLSARKISNARFRGLGSSPANPAVRAASAASA